MSRETTQQSQPNTKSTSRPPPLTLGPRNQPRQAPPNPNLAPPPPLLPPPTLVLPLPFFIPIPTPVPLLVPVPPEKYYGPKKEEPVSAESSENSRGENLSNCSSPATAEELVLDEQRRRRRALIIDKPSHTER